MSDVGYFQVKLSKKKSPPNLYMYIFEVSTKFTNRVVKQVQFWHKDTFQSNLEFCLKKIVAIIRQSALCGSAQLILKLLYKMMEIAFYSLDVQVALAETINSLLNANEIVGR